MPCHSCSWSPGEATVHPRSAPSINPDQLWHHSSLSPSLPPLSQPLFKSNQMDKTSKIETDAISHESLIFTPYYLLCPPQLVFPYSQRNRFLFGIWRNPLTFILDLKTLSFSWGQCSTTSDFPNTEGENSLKGLCTITIPTSSPSSLSWTQWKPGGHSHWETAVDEVTNNFLVAGHTGTPGLMIHFP